MKVIIPKLNIAIQSFFRHCGYLEISNPHKNNEISYARSLDPGRFYPRFHIYIEDSQKEIKLNLHLDAKKPSYEGTAAHGGEYEGPVVKNEEERIKIIAQKFISKKLESSLGFQNKKSLWQKLKNRIWN